LIGPDGLVIEQVKLSLCKIHLIENPRTSLGESILVGWCFFLNSRWSSCWASILFDGWLKVVGCANVFGWTSRMVVNKLQHVFNLLGEPNVG